MIYPPGNVVGSDVTAQYSFWRAFFADSIVHGEGIPLWNPYVFSGMPFIGNPLSAIFYPFSWLFVFGNPDLLFGWLFFIDVLLIGIFTFIFARTINLSRLAALFSAVAFMFSGTVVLRIYAGHLSNLDAIVWFPLILVFFERSFLHNRYTNGIGAGIALALMFLGNIQFALYGACGVMAYITGRVLIERTLPTPGEKCRHLAAVLFLSIGICGLLILIPTLPMMEYSPMSNRAGGVSYDFSSAISLPPSSLTTAVYPDAFGNPLLGVNPSLLYWELCFYAGILPLLLALLGILFNRSWRTCLFLAIAVLAMLFSLGKYFPLYGLFYQYVPGFSIMRIPPSMLFVYTFFLAVLAGIGLDAAFRDQRTAGNRFTAFSCNPWVRRVTLALAGLCGIIILWMAVWGPRGAGSILPVLFAYVGCVILFCIWPYLRCSKKPQPAYAAGVLKVALVALLVLDLFIFGMRFIDTKSPAEVFRNPDFVPVIKNETDSWFRVYDETDLLNQNIAYRNDLYLVSGYDPTYLREYQAYFIRSQSENYTGYYWWMQGAVIKDFDILRRLNVRYIVTARNYDRDFAVPGLQCVYDNRSVRVYRLNTTYPRAYLIPESEFGNATPVSLQPAPLERYSPDEIIVSATTEGPAYLVLSEVWYPGWSARDNGRPAGIVRYHELFRAVHLDPGTHRVSFAYFPQILKLTG